MSEKREKTPPLRTVIVDDEAPARHLLREYLESVEDLEIVAECANGFEAVKAVSELEPDVLLLDIQMPKLDGFEVLELVAGAGRAPAVIFISAYDRYAVRAFEIHAVDYLLKPYSRERLIEALERVRPRAADPPPPVDAAQLRREAARGSLDRVLVRDGSRIHVLPCRQLDYIEAQDDSVLLVSGELKLRKTERLTRLEEQLDPRRFVRIHRSYVLNVERLAKLELYAKDSRLAILRDGTRLPVSRAGYARLREML
ncbi:MAG: LytTR family DNA-binding domain-containing protein [Acidobacteriota bacterium]